MIQVSLYFYLFIRMSFLFSFFFKFNLECLSFKKNFFYLAVSGLHCITWDLLFGAWTLVVARGLSSCGTQA